MTFMIGSDELGKTMYDAWCKSARKNLKWSPTYKIPPWEHIGAAEQECWKDVAREIGGVLGDAIGAA